MLSNSNSIKQLETSVEEYLKNEMKFKKDP